MPAANTRDPFESSRMTFGEHLEELRTALLRAAAGILVGFLVGLLMAPTVVKWIEWPLRKALRRHYLAVAKEKVESHSAMGAAQQWTAIEDLSMVPTRMYIDKTNLVQQLGLPFESDDDPSYYRPTDIRTKSCKTIAQEIVAQRDKQIEGPTLEIWRSLPSLDRESLLLVSEGAQTGLIARHAIADALNTVIRNTGFHNSGSFDSLSHIVDDDQQRAFLQRSRKQIELELDEQASRILNRQILDSVWPNHVRRFRPKLAEMVVWQPVDTSVQALGVVEPFLIYIKAALILGVILSSPWVFLQIWEFVSAGLYPREKNFVYRFLPLSIGLFLLGTAVAFCFVFEPVLDFLFQFNRQLNISAQPRISDWISFVLILPLGFGISFQLPLAMLIAERLGLITVETYLANWKIAVIVVFVLSMFLTPADPMSMLLMAVPLTVLYFGGIALCKYAPGMPVDGERASALQEAGA